MASKKARRPVPVHPSNATMLSRIHELDGSGEGFVSESYHRPEDVVYFGSDDEYYESSAQRTERCRAKFEAYLNSGGHQPPLVMSASLKGPFDSKSWENPWRTRGLRAATRGTTKQLNDNPRRNAPRQHLPTSKRQSTSAADSTSLDTSADINPACTNQRKMTKALATASRLAPVTLVSESTAKTHAPTLLPMTDSDALPNPFNPRKRQKQTAVDWLRRPSPVKKRKPGLAEQHEPPPSSPSEQAAINRKRAGESRASLMVVTEGALDGVPMSSSTRPSRSSDKPRLSLSSGIIVEDSTMPDDSTHMSAALTPCRDVRSPSALTNPEQEAVTSRKIPFAAPLVTRLSSSITKRKKTPYSETGYPSPARPASSSSSPLSSIDSSKFFEAQQDESFCFKAKVRQASKALDKKEQFAGQTHTTEANPASWEFRCGEDTESEPVVEQQIPHKSQKSSKHQIQQPFHNTIPESGNRDDLERNCGVDNVVNETIAVQEDVPPHFTATKARFSTQDHRVAESTGNGTIFPARLSELKIVLDASSPLEADQTLLSSQLVALQSTPKPGYPSQQSTRLTAGDHQGKIMQNSQNSSSSPISSAETTIDHEGEHTTKFEADETTLVQGSFSGVPEVYSKLKVDRVNTEISLAGLQQSLRLQETGTGTDQNPDDIQNATVSPLTHSQPVSSNDPGFIRIAKLDPVTFSQPLSSFSARSELAVSSRRTQRPSSQPLQNGKTSPLSSLSYIARSSLNMYLGAVSDQQATGTILSDQAIPTQIVEETNLIPFTSEGLPQSANPSSRSASPLSQQAPITNGSTDENGDDCGVDAERQSIHDATETRDSVASQKTCELAVNTERSPKLASQDQSPWRYSEDRSMRPLFHINNTNDSLCLSQNMQSSPPLPIIQFSFSGRGSTDSQRSPTPVTQSPWTGDGMATPRARHSQSKPSHPSRTQCISSQEVPNPVLPSFTNAQKSKEPDNSNLQPTVASIDCRPSTPEDKLSSLPTPELTFSLKPFRRFLSPSPRSERRKSRPTPNRASCTQDILSINPWAQESRPAKQVRWAPLPGSEDLAEGEGLVVAALSPSTNEENESESDNSSSDDAAGDDDDDEDYIEAGLSRSGRSRNVTRAKKTAAAVLASSVQPFLVSTRPHSPPPPTRIFADDLPSEVTLFQNHFAKVDSERNMFKPKSLKRRLVDDTDLVQQSPGAGSQPVDAVARRFAEADAVSSVRPAAAKKPRSSILSKPASSPLQLEQNENEQPVDDVSAVIDNLGDFLGGWDVDVELTQSAREREQTEAQSNYMSLSMGISPWV